MKVFPLFIIALTFITGAVALADDSTPTVQSVELKAKEVTITGDEAILVRTAETPKKVKVHMNIPFGERVCVEWDQREVYGPDVSCGYDYHCSYQCNVWQNGHCVGYGQVCHSDMRSCYHFETVCVRTDVVTHARSRSFKLTFKNASDLAPGEVETFEVKGYQPHVGSSDDKYTFAVKESKIPYSVKKSWFFGDFIKVKGQKDQK